MKPIPSLTEEQKKVLDEETIEEYAQAQTSKSNYSAKYNSKYCRNIRRLAEKRLGRLRAAAMRQGKGGKEDRESFLKRVMKSDGKFISSSDPGSGID